MTAGPDHHYRRPSIVVDLRLSPQNIIFEFIFLLLNASIGSAASLFVVHYTTWAGMIMQLNVWAVYGNWALSTELLWYGMALN